MLYTIDNPAGIDKVIQPMQTALYELCESWGDINGYGRVHLNNKNGAIVPEHYMSSGDYKEVLTNDMKVATFFFVEEPVLTYQGGCLSKNTLHTIFIVDLKKAKPDISHYADEEVRIEVLRLLQCYYSKIESMVKGERALEGMSSKRLDFIYPYFIFKITGIINNY